MNRQMLLAATMLLAAMVVPAASQEKKGKGKAAGSPEEAVKYLLAAARAGDTEGFDAQQIATERNFLRAVADSEKVTQA